jgi:ATP-dependent DNA helicase PIF1
VGDGREETFPELGDDLIRIPPKLKSESKTLKEFAQEIFPGLTEMIETSFQNHQEQPTLLMDYLVRRAIISPSNKNNGDINEICTDMVHNQPMMIYRSSDKMLNPTESLKFPIEFLNKISLSGMPDHILVIKKGMPIMLLSNLDKKNGHANGSRYIVMDMSPKIIYALGIGETNRGKILLMPRIIFQPKDQEIPFEMERRQFPVRPCFAMTSNKSQGQNLDVVGLNLTQEFFTHGQTFTACSRATSSNGLKIFKPENTAHPNHMANVVYTELLD